MDLFSCLSPFVFCSFASGSSGNCYFVGVDNEGLLIDAGISATHIKKGLQQIGVPASGIKAILLTHDHVDHVRGLEVFAKSNGISIYAHEECVDALLHGPYPIHLPSSCFHVLEMLEPIELSGIAIEPFPVSHDGHGTVGYHLSYQGASLTIATDVGELDPVVEHFLESAQSIVIESNYDDEMLWKGNYPYPLKKRIASSKGHLSNLEASRFVMKHYENGYKNVMFCHLSENNNTPEVAMQCFYRQLRLNRLKPSPDVAVFPLPRHKCTGLIHL